MTDRLVMAEMTRDEFASAWWTLKAVDEWCEAHGLDYPQVRHGQFLALPKAYQQRFLRRAARPEKPVERPWIRPLMPDGSRASYCGPWGFANFLDDYDEKLTKEFDRIIADYSRDVWMEEPCRKG